MTNGPLQPVLSPSIFSTKTTGATVVPYAVRLPRNPTVDDRNYPVGSIWVNTATESLFGLGGIVGGEARWAPLGDHPLGDLRTLTGDSGGAVSGTIFNIDIVGGVASGITVDGVPSSSTLLINTAVPVYTGSVTTVGAQTLVAVQWPTLAGTATAVTGRVVGYATHAVLPTTALGGFVSGTTVNETGSAQPVEVGDIIINNPNVVGASYSLTTNAQFGQIAVTGVAGWTIDWTVQVNLTESA